MYHYLQLTTKSESHKEKIKQLLWTRAWTVFLQRQVNARWGSQLEVHSHGRMQTWSKSQLLVLTLPHSSPLKRASKMHRRVMLKTWYWIRYANTCGKSLALLTITGKKLPDSSHLISRYHHWKSVFSSFKPSTPCLSLPGFSYQKETFHSI